MKILIVGDWQYPMYEKAIADSMKQQGYEVLRYSWDKYLNKNIFGKAESKYCVVGPMTMLFNFALRAYVLNQRPDYILFWRATQLLPSTVRAIKKTNVKAIASYNHDDFSGPEFGAPVPKSHHRLWRLFLDCAPLIDIHFVKRQSNIHHLKTLGAKYASIMPMWFDPRMHRPVGIGMDEQEKFQTDVVFVGHYEPDGREQRIRALVETGFQVKLWGGHYWSRQVLGDLYDRLQPIQPAEGDDYAKALCGAKICLAFLSKLNRDTYTRRCFEIPACGRLMLAERTEDLQRLFREDEEACFFSSNEELVQKVRWLLANPEIRERIAAAGLQRVWADGHDVASRAKQFLQALTQEISTPKTLPTA
jgi:spore maturation protein CgeB